MTADGSLRGRRLLIPRAGAWGERVAAIVRARGGEPVIAPLIQTRPPRDVAARNAAFAELRNGRYDWVFLTSAASVEQLVAEKVTIPHDTHVAAVGRATARAVIDAGYDVDFVPTGRSSAATMIAQWCAGHDPRTVGRALVLRSDLAMAVVSDELHVRGYAADVCIAYRTVGVDLAADVVRRVREGDVDVVLLTSTSVVRELCDQVGQVPASTLLASLGPGTTAEAERRGLSVAVTAPTQSIESLLDALYSANSSSSPSTEHLS